MDDNKFFKWLWRINAIAIFLIVVCVCLIVTIEFISSQIRRANRTPPAQIESVIDDPEGLEKWRLGSAESIHGSDLMMLPLVSEHKEFTESHINGFSGAYSSKAEYSGYGDPFKNILFINKESTQAYWMFDNVERLILSKEQFPYPAYPAYKQKDNETATRAIFFTIVINDSNKDGLIDYEDDSSLAVSSPEGKDFQIVLPEYDRIIHRTLMDNGNVLMLYQQNGIGYSMVFALNPFKVITNKALPKIKE